MGKNVQMSAAEIARKRNSAKMLECSECCTIFTLNEDGKWRSGEKTANLMFGRTLFCTCNTPIGVIIPKTAVPGEVLGTL